MTVRSETQLTDTAPEDRSCLGVIYEFVLYYIGQPSACLSGQDTPPAPSDAETLAASVQMRQIAQVSRHGVKSSSDLRKGWSCKGRLTSSSF